MPWPSMRWGAWLVAHARDGWGAWRVRGCREGPQGGSAGGGDSMPGLMPAAAAGGSACRHWLPSTVQRAPSSTSRAARGRPMGAEASRPTRRPCGNLTHSPA
jgi:hypothetical protein